MLRGLSRVHAHVGFDPDMSRVGVLYLPGLLDTQPLPGHFRFIGVAVEEQVVLLGIV